MTERQVELLNAYQETGNIRFFAKAVAIEKKGEMYDHTRGVEQDKRDNYEWRFLHNLPTLQAGM